MNGNPNKLVSAKRLTDKSQTRTATPAAVDDEFHEFFNQGDVGDYEGGVAYSQPPSKLLPPIDEPQIMADSSLHRARRAFFARVVAVVLTACVVLLVTAARFKPHGGTSSESAIRRWLTEDIRLMSPPVVAKAPPTMPAVPPAAAAAPPPPAQEVVDEATEPEPAAKLDDSASNSREVEAAKPAEPAPVAKAQPAEPARVAKEQPASRGAGTAKASGRIAQKAFDGIES